MKPITTNVKPKLHARLSSPSRVTAARNRACRSNATATATASDHSAHPGAAFARIAFTPLRKPRASSSRAVVAASSSSASPSSLLLFSRFGFVVAPEA